MCNSKSRDANILADALARYGMRTRCTDTTWTKANPPSPDVCRELGIEDDCFWAL